MRKDDMSESCLSASTEVEWMLMRVVDRCLWENRDAVGVDGNGLALARLEVARVINFIMELII